MARRQVPRRVVLATEPLAALRARAITGVSYTWPHVKLNAQGLLALVLAGHMRLEVEVARKALAALLAEVALLHPGRRAGPGALGAPAGDRRDAHLRVGWRRRGPPGVGGGRGAGGAGVAGFWEDG
jgi:hypothetical protein